MSSSQGQGQKRSRKDKSVASSSALPPAPVHWPKTPGAPFQLPSHLRPTAFDREKSMKIEGFLYRATSEQWLPYHSVFYNGLLNVTFDATRVLKRDSLDSLGISKQVSLLLRNMGVGTIATETYDLYPELARQFLATCEVVYDEDSYDHAAGRLTFMCHGKRYWLTLDDLAGIFKMDTDARERGFDNSTLGRMTCFWNAIAFGKLTQADMKISRIRNPVLRIVAKALGHTFFGKKEPGGVRQDELMMLFLGLGDLMVAQAEFRDSIGELHRVHMGAYFAEVLSLRKYKGLGTAKEERIEPIGSLLTPILKFCRVDMPDSLIDRQTPPHFIDDTYLANARICRRKIYQWTAPRGVTRFCKLPKTDWAALRTWEQVRFELPDSERCSQDGSPVIAIPEPEQEYYSQPPPTTGASTSTAAGQFCAHGAPFSAPTPIVEDFPEEYYADMEPLPAGASFEAWRERSDRIQTKQTGILRRILRGLTKIRWVPPPACCSAPEDVQEPVHSPVPSIPAEMSSGESSHRSGGGSGASSSSAGRERQRARHD